MLLATGCASLGAGGAPTPDDTAIGWATGNWVDAPGTGLLMVSDLPADTGLRDAPTTTVRAALTPRADDCIVAVVDGVEHVPFWPDGTQLASQEHAGIGVQLSVMLAGDDLAVGGTSPETPAQGFTASAYVGDGGELVDVARLPEGDDALCAASTPPVVFPDASSIHPDAP